MKVTTMRGVTLDVSQLLAENEKTVAIGNAKMNARGDLIGANGQVITKREEVAQAYYKRNPKAVKQVSLADVKVDTFLSPVEAVAQVKQQIAEQRAKRDSVQKDITDSE